MNWGTFAEQAPELAAEGEKRIESTGVVLVGTLTKDGSPRITPVEAVLFEGLLLLGMQWQSKKALDLLRDPRCLIHNMIANRHAKEGEFKLRGRAVDVQDAELRLRYAEALYKKIDFRIEEPYHLFSVDIESATLISYESEKRNIQRWP